MKKTVLITGTSGFIGSHLIKKIPNHISTLGNDGENVDLRSRNEVLKFKKVDTVIHLAGKIPSEKNFSKNIFFEHNVLGTLNILEYCVKKKIKKIIYVSSYIYGNPPKNPINEKEIVQPHNTYTKSKFLAEELCKIYGERFGIKLIILRPFNIFGSSLKNNFLISNILKSIKNNKSITINMMGIPDSFIEHGTRQELLDLVGLNTNSLINLIADYIYDEKLKESS